MLRAVCGSEEGDDLPGVRDGIAVPHTAADLIDLPLGMGQVAVQPQGYGGPQGELAACVAQVRLANESFSPRQVVLVRRLDVRPPPPRLAFLVSSWAWCASAGAELGGRPRRATPVSVGSGPLIHQRNWALTLLFPLKLLMVQVVELPLHAPDQR